MLYAVHFYKHYTEHMVIYALFICAQILAGPNGGAMKMTDPRFANGTTQCEMQNVSSGITAGNVFRTLADCQRYVHFITGQITSPKDGRFPLEGGILWYECRHKHVDTWER